jgi:hypothetical protein
MATVAQQILGNRYYLEISIDGGVTYNKIGGMTSADESETGEEADASTFDTVAFKEYLNALIDAEISISGNYVTNDVGLANLLAYQRARLPFKLKAYPKKLAGSGIPFVAWDAFARDKSHAAAMNTAQSYSFTFRVQNPTFGLQT